MNQNRNRALCVVIAAPAQVNEIAIVQLQPLAAQQQLGRGTQQGGDGLQMRTGDQWVRLEKAGHDPTARRRVLHRGWEGHDQPMVHGTRSGVCRLPRRIGIRFEYAFRRRETALIGRSALRCFETFSAPDSSAAVYF